MKIFLQSAGLFAALIILQFTVLSTALFAEAGRIEAVPGGIARKAIPACKGKNIIDEIRTVQPQLYNRLLDEASTVSNDGVIFWKIEAPGVAPSYLFGTFHSTTSEITKLAAPVKAALDGASTLAVEVANLDTNSIQSFMQNNSQMFFSLTGPKLDELLSAQDYALVKQAAKKAKLPAHMVPLLKPWFANNSFYTLPLCEVTRMNSGLAILDKKIMKDAVSQGKNIVGLETLKDQFSAFANLPIKHQVTLLEDGIYVRNRLADYYTTSMKLYQQRKLGMLLPLSIAMGRDRAKTRAALKVFKQLLIVDRNKKMARNAMPLLRKGGVFIAVGALHLPGKDGLVSLLRQQGLVLGR